VKLEIERNRKIQLRYIVSNFQLRHPAFNSIIHPISETKIALKTTIKDRIATYDPARQVKGATKIKCSEFVEAVVKMMN